ncbi:hypothetical protein ABKN59_002326 [Abortiporus biennis]
MQLVAGHIYPSDSNAQLEFSSRAYSFHLRTVYCVCDISDTVKHGMMEAVRCREQRDIIKPEDFPNTD